MGEDKPREACACDASGASTRWPSPSGKALLLGFNEEGLLAHLGDASAGMGVGEHGFHPFRAVDKRRWPDSRDRHPMVTLPT